MEEDDSQNSGSHDSQAEKARSAQFEELRKARAAELQARSVLKQILEPSAYERLANIRAANAELYAQLTQLFLYLAQNGQLKSRVSEAQLKEFVSRLLAKQRRETKIVRVRK